MREPTLLSLFDGSGGFPLAASMCGIRPVACSEIEPYPISVTKSRFPDMKHLGSVTDIKGGEIEPVDVITFGSPCQDLSVAGKRAGLKHTDNGDDETTRSGLFMEAVRIIKEMREATNGKYPKFAVWENVPGAFSSNQGEDFRIVLEELIKIAEPSAVMPEVPKNGWSYADSYCGDGWSLAYRVLDAQYWGVPQRRRRIYLVLDLRGECAGKISFEREGLRGYFETGRTPWQTITGDAEDGFGTADSEGAVGLDGYNSTTTGDKSATLGVNCGMSTGRNGVVQVTGINGDVAGTLDASYHKGCGMRQGVEREVVVTPVAYSLDPVSSNSMKSSNPHSGCRQTEIARTLDTFDPNPCKNQGGIAIVEPVVETAYSINHQGGNVEQIIEEKVGTLTAAMNSSGNNKLSVAYPYTLKIRSGCEGGGKGALVQEDKSATLATNNDQYLFQPICFEPGAASRLGGYCYEDKCGTLRATMGDNQFAVAFQTYQKVTGPLMANSHPGSYTGQDAFSDMLVAGVEQTKVYRQGGFSDYIEGEVGTLRAAGGDLGGGSENLLVAGVDARNATEYPEKTGTLQAKPGGGFSLNCNQVVRVQYIVRRLTPTECARLQGFPDKWGHPIEKIKFTDDEYQFWLSVRKTYDTIQADAVIEAATRVIEAEESKAHPNPGEIEKQRKIIANAEDRKLKDYTKDQMLKWYNNLHTDSSEYKMWGNGIALPNALYIMQGIAEVMAEEKAALRKWLDDLLK